MFVHFVCLLEFVCACSVLAAVCIGEEKTRVGIVLVDAGLVLLLRCLREFDHTLRLGPHFVFFCLVGSAASFAENDW